VFDVDWVRQQFPALATPWALMDNAGGSVLPQTVIDRAVHYMAHYQVQLGAGYGPSVEAAEAVEAGKAAAASLLGASKRDVVVGPSTTLNFATVARALRPLWSDGDEVIVTDLDHESNIGAWRRLPGIKIKVWKFREDDLALHVEDLAPLLTDKTRLVSFTHCPNITGGIQDVGAAISMIHDAGALACVDGVAYGPHRHVDAAAIGADLYAVSLYKIFGPHIGAIYGTPELLRAAHGQNHAFIPEDDVPYKLQPGNVNHELTASMVGVADYFEAVDKHHRPGAPAEGRLARVFADIADHEEHLGRHLLDYLHSRSDIRVLGPQSADKHERVPTIAFVIKGLSSQHVAESLLPDRLGIRFGHFYAQRAVERLGLLECDGIVRASLAHYNTLDEVQRLVQGLDRIKAG